MLSGQRPSAWRMAVATCALIVAALQIASAQPQSGIPSAFVDPTAELQQLSVAGIESGRASAAGTPVAVQEAYLKDVLGNSTDLGRQSVRNSVPPWTPTASKWLPAGCMSRGSLCGTLAAQC